MQGRILQVSQFHVFENMLYHSQMHVLPHDALGKQANKTCHLTLFPFLLILLWETSNLLFPWLLSNIPYQLATSDDVCFHIFHI
nr:MAG TPA: hypothetical protein [Caudoviricetes sp.]